MFTASKKALGPEKNPGTIRERMLSILPETPTQGVHTILFVQYIYQADCVVYQYKMDPNRKIPIHMETIP